MQSRKSQGLFVTELAIVIVIVLAVACGLILPKATMHFQELTVSFYTNGTMDFSADATALVRSLATISILTLGLGLSIGAALALTVCGHAKATAQKHGYETILETAGLVTVNDTPQGITYQLTENGRRFLRDYAFLNLGLQEERIAQRTT